MKNNTTKNSIFLTIICAVFIGFFGNVANAQKKQKARIKVQYSKVGATNTLSVSGKYKAGRKYKPAANLDLKIYQIFKNDSLDYLGEVSLNKAGKAVYNLDQIFKNNLKAYHFKVIHKASKTFKKVAKTLNIKVANLKAELKYADEKPFIFATLTDAENNPLEGVELKVNLQRLFSPISVGSGPYFTDKKGTINVPITRKMPGLEGKLTYQVILEDSDDFGTIKSVIKTKIGTHIKDLSTFDQRTMWSPPMQAPLVILIIPNLLIFGIWLIIFFLIFNLYKISKQKHT